MSSVVSPVMGDSEHPSNGNRSPSGTGYNITKTILYTKMMESHIIASLAMSKFKVTIEIGLFYRLVGLL